MYEISNDPTTDTHILVPSGYGGLNDEELQAMEDQVRKANNLRTREHQEMIRVRQEEQARLKALDDKEPAYKKQWEKYTGRKLGEPEQLAPSEKTNKEGEHQLVGERQPVGGKAGCTSCAKKGLMGLIKGRCKVTQG